AFIRVQMQWTYVTRKHIRILDKAAWLKVEEEDWRLAEETRVWFKLKPF
ncbi:hypothetical protein Tco_0267703, partial [Tanacetum coccineum]